MLTDPISDYLTRIRNAQMAGHQVVDVPSSNLKKEITRILCEQGYILDYRFDDDFDSQGNIKIALKYSNSQKKSPAIKKIIRVSRPGLRRYSDSKNLPRVINGLGIAIVSTSKGVITAKKAKELNVGGEVICYVY